MSLINKMLQDLDARGESGAAAVQVDVKPVAREERRWSLTLALALLGGTVAIAAAGALGWRYLHQPPVRSTSTPRPALVVMRAAPQVAPQVGWAAVPTRTTALPAPVARTKAPVPAEQVGPAQPGRAAEPASAQALPKSRPAPHNRPRLDPATRPKPATAQAAPAQGIAAAAAKPAADARQGSARRGEDAYRRALASLQDGRVTEAIASLEQALQLEPRHEAARQTLIGLLVESGRVDEAMRQLQQALAADARQPALAMLLARLQIERGASGIDTLTRTLPYAGGNGEYQAFLAGALQRQGRHAEAAGQYQAALRAAPGNGVWWMGLGISLLADKRDADARAAFQRAEAAGTLAPELQAFVERKLQRLAH